MGDARPQPSRGPGGAVGTEPGRRSPPPPAGALAFAGSDPDDVAAARAFWSSAALPPPLESCLGPAAPRLFPFLHVIFLSGGSTALQGPLLVRKSEKNSEKERILEAHNMQKTEEKEKYLQQAKKREEILALLRKQREERIAKELISHPYKPKTKTDQLRGKVSDSEFMDQEAVKALK
ncbi:cilia- and flagella-associated protein HOATZ [Apteryx mantelli]|uniref:Cilia- and flagella-associated protein HOATZ n=1 Tax=Apteryx mantelli TaxID=2696672 RepID=A0ABM4FME0_9AVES